MEMEELTFDGQKLWKPTTDTGNQMDTFRTLINEKYSLNLANYNDLYNWSCKCYNIFWQEVWSYANIIHSHPYETVVDMSMGINQIPKWFVGGKLNYAENIFERECNSKDRIAIYVANETSNEVISTVTFGQLKRRVRRYVDSMKTLGIGVNDRVVGYLPNGQEAIEMYLACSVLGCVWSSTSPDFGVTGVLDRFKQIKPKLIFSVDAVVYNGKVHDHLSKLGEVIDGLPELQYVVVAPLDLKGRQMSRDSAKTAADFLKHLPGGHLLEDFLNLTPNQTESDELPYEQLDFSHPLCILYSSGTTGPPKCMVHSVGGTLIQHMKEHMLHGNLSSKDIMIYYTTTGWMMWNWMISALAVGSSIVTYDGSPFRPTETVLWDLVDSIGITVFGTSAKMLDIMEHKEILPGKSHKLTSLHSLLSTGSPLKPQSFRYVYKSIKNNLILGSITGGSDIISLFCGNNCALPVYVGEIQGRNLGMAVACYDESGNSVVGQKGELVCLKAFPSMPVMFLNDSDGAKYQKAYFSKYTGVWNHGDFCAINPATGGIIMLGRSDATLNPNGVRFGSTEIYNVIESMDEIDDSVCVSHFDQQANEKVVLFVKLKPNIGLDDQLLARVKTEIGSKLSVRHIPAIILAVNDIPYTINGKKVEIAVKMTIAGKEFPNRDSLMNCESLELYKALPQLQ